MKKKKNNGLILVIAVLFLIAIASVFFVSQSIGKATKAIDSKAMIEEKIISTYIPNTTQLTEFNIPTKEQLDTTSISQTFKENTEIDLKLDKPINAFSVTGSATLLSEAGLVRIILVDSEKHEYLVYETSSLLTENQKEIKFGNTCEETCVLDKPITAVSMKIQVEDAVLNLSSVNTLAEDKSFTEIKDIKSYKQQTLEAQSKAKIEKYNSAQNSWTAGETSVSNLSYENQKRLFTREDGTIPEYLPNLQGFLYYKGGIFTLKETKEQHAKAQDNTTPYTPPEIDQENIILPNSWDWRDVHGENWMTPAKDQMSTPSCGMFSVVGAVEASINLYYNQHLNVDLSEQSLISNMYTIYRTFPLDGFPPPNLPQCYEVSDFDNLAGELCGIKYVGLCDEECYPFANIYDPFGVDENGNLCDLPNINCTMGWGLCSNHENRSWKINNFLLLNPIAPPNWFIKPLTEKKLKQDIIKYGPLAGTFGPWAHAMTIVGYSNQSDWKIIDDCAGNMCGPTKECIPTQCNIPGNQMNMCVNDWVSNAGQSLMITYECQESGGPGSNDYSWQFTDNMYLCDENQKCINNQCQDESLFNLTEGYTDCAYMNLSSPYYSKVVQYLPNQGSTYWIFKNSWGEDWGNAGYILFLASINDLTTRISFSPITPPTDHSYWPAGFNNTINCEDRDGDHYCNWGISEQKPSTCPSFCNAEKDCDDSNPDFLGFKSKTDLRCRYRYEIQN